MKLAPALLILFVAICVNYLVVFINYRNKKIKGTKYKWKCSGCYGKQDILWCATTSEKSGKF